MADGVVIDDVRIVVGRAVPISMDVKLAGSPHDTTNDGFQFCLKRNESDADSDALITKKSTLLTGGDDTQILRVTPDGGVSNSQIHILLTAADTAALDNVDRSYFFDVVISRPGANVHTLICGTIAFRRSVTVSVQTI